MSGVFNERLISTLLSFRDSLPAHSRKYVQTNFVPTTVKAGISGIFWSIRAFLYQAAHTGSS